MNDLSQHRNSVLFGFLGFLGILMVLLGAESSSAIPPVSVTLAKAVEQCEFVGIVRIKEVPVMPKMGFRADAPPTVIATPLSVLKGDEKTELRIVWQTYWMVCIICDRETVVIVPPAVGDEYMVYLGKGKDGTFDRLGYQWHFHKLSAVPNARVQPSWDNAWRGLMELSPPVAGPGEVVNYRFSRTRLAAEPWTGTNSNLIAEDIGVIDFARKRLLDCKEKGLRKTAPEVVGQGETVVDLIDLTAAFGVTEPGEYWVFGGGAAEGNSPLRFHVSDKLRLRTDKK